MKLREIIETLSATLKIPVEEDEHHIQIQNKNLRLYYGTIHPKISPSLNCISNSTGLDFTFCAKETLPLNIIYTVKADFIMERLAFFREMKSKPGTSFFEAFLGAEYDPFTELFQAPTWKKPEEVAVFHTRSLVVSYEELLAFSRDHIKL